MTSREAKESKIIPSKKSAMLSWKPRPILSPELTEPVPLEEVYVGKLKDRKTTSKAIQIISTALPGFGHLKRCNGVRLLLAPLVNDESEDKESPKITSSDDLRHSLNSKGFDLSLLENEFEIIKVPKKAAKTKIQAMACSDIWPVNFHPDPQIEAIISGDMFTTEQLCRIEILMRIAIEAARRESVGNSECNGSALVVDPENGEPLVLACSKIDQHPMWHAAMLAIDLVAKLQGGGTWDLHESDLKVRDRSETGKKRQLNNNSLLFYPPSLRDIEFPCSETRPLEQKAIRKNKTCNIPGDIEHRDTTGPYLCTNLWVFLVQEPCALCAMALLHSRVSKIFYGIPGERGVLGSKIMLHITPGLNHRYQVWSGILEDECRRVCNEIKARNCNKHK